MKGRDDARARARAGDDARGVARGVARARDDVRLREGSSQIHLLPVTCDYR